MKKILFLCVVSVFGLSIEGKAQGWFAGVEGGYIKHEFNPKYTFVGGGSAEFHDTSDGLELGLVAGYDFAVAERFSLLTQFRGAWNNSEWTLFLPGEPARFKYDNPVTLGLSAQPTFKISDKLGIFAELGILEGKFNEEKRSPSSIRSSYDFSDWIFGYTLGGGISYRFTDALECRLGYRKTIYNDFSYAARFPSGSRRSTVRDEPESESFTLSFLYRF